MDGGDFDDEDWNEACPDCGAKLVSKWSGVMCPDTENCGWWFCY